ncbi:unnamed protein product [marine sediment metagenome]|uniref:Uncharacterized protein n=1 Tax=marine sediment metagenome TaxID=412755 RepID=X1D1C0_9ZZZZ
MHSKINTAKSQVDRTWPGVKYTKKTAWHECLFHFARHLDGIEWTEKQRKFYIGRGQFFCRKSDLAKRWGWGRRTVQRFFARKAQSREIVQEVFDGIGTLITIVDFNQAQEDYYK